MITQLKLFDDVDTAILKLLSDKRPDATAVARMLQDARGEALKHRRLLISVSKRLEEASRDVNDLLCFGTLMSKHGYEETRYSKVWTAQTGDGYVKAVEKLKATLAAAERYLKP